MINKEKKEIYEFKKFYKFISRCKICGRIYGSDIKKDNLICPRHILGYQRFQRIMKKIDTEKVL